MNQERTAKLEGLMAAALAPKNWESALSAVERNKGAPGPDGMRASELRVHLASHGEVIRKRLLEGSCRPGASKRRDIPKPSGGTRPLSIPNVQGRFVQQLLLGVLQPVFEPRFSESSYGFRPGRSAHDAVKAAQGFAREGFTHVVDMDITKFFDKVNHDILMTKIESCCRVGKRLAMKESRYAHARQMNRARAVQRKLKTNLGRVIREIERQNPSSNGKTASLLKIAERIHAQKPQDSGKVYSVHEPKVECIAKGKTGKKYEFGNKISLAVTSKGSWIVGTMSLECNPYDGHTLSSQLKQVRDFLGEGRVREVFVDRGYREHKHEGKEVVYVDRERRGSIPKNVWRFMKRRAAIEPTIGHMKSEHRLERNRLKGTLGNAVNALLSAAAMNFGKLLKWVGQFWFFFSALLRMIFSPFAALCVA